MQLDDPGLLYELSILPVDQLSWIAECKALSYREAKPFPHSVIDNVFDEAILGRVLREFPRENDIAWEKIR
jgi:hypothetical protein